MKIKVRYKMLSPVSQIGETASTGSYFNMILTAYGKVPVITGNSVRGQIRDSAASYLLNALDCKVSKEVFHVLFSGGNINGAMRDDVEKAKSVREHFPLVSLLGAGLGDMIMAGKTSFSFLYPVCRETEEITGEAVFGSWHDMIDEIEFTRTDDSKNDLKAKYITDALEEIKASASQQMRFAVQYMAAGTEFVQMIDLSDSATDMEIGALLTGFVEWFKHPKLGGMYGKGFGRFDANVGDGMIIVSDGVVTLSADADDYISRYNQFIKSEGAEYFDLLTAKKGAKKGGKKTDSTD